MSGVSRSVWEIHLPQSLNEEATADEFSEWEQVISLTSAVRRSPQSLPLPRLLRPPYIQKKAETRLPSEARISTPFPIQKRFLLVSPDNPALTQIIR
ncbi:hypothetical protein ADH70_013990 [Blautia pseudococcoides]|uniref:Uncharacterized protein n=1 Tax=Blautia pseudococcoides TaxID=1796616 RepID=A0A1V0QEQ0_9FIRM|nr:hypothetical protein A4V09_24225 [Blautia pseudococcoides]ASU29831.1 hypothetical protein ADH70_013990 [Blautia pseudococcoides]